MPLDLIRMLPAFLPRAIRWAEDHSRRVLEHGSPLPPPLLELAAAAGVKWPHRIRTQRVAEIPWPADNALVEAGLESGLISHEPFGIALHYGLYLCKDPDRDRESFVHECRHVAQYECFGSIRQFLPEYLLQIAIYGVDDAPLEVDARNATEHYKRGVGGGGAPRPGQTAMHSASPNLSPVLRRLPSDSPG